MPMMSARWRGRRGERVVHRASRYSTSSARALRVLDRPVVVGVGGADVACRTCRPSVGPTARRTGSACPSAPEMITAMSLRTCCHGIVMCMPLAGRIVCGCDALVEAADLVGPHARGRHDDLRPDGDRRRRRCRRARRRRGRRPSGARPVTRASVDDHGAVLAAVRATVEREPRVVGARVVVHEPRRQAVGRERRARVRAPPRRSEPPVQLADPGAAGDVVHPQRRPQRPGDLLRDRAVLR